MGAYKNHFLHCVASVVFNCTGIYGTHMDCAADFDRDRIDLILYVQKLKGTYCVYLMDLSKLCWMIWVKNKKGCQCVKTH